MSLPGRNLKFITAAMCIYFLLYAVDGFARVYVYEVITETTSFHTASKLPPDAFLIYNGGEDVIHSLKILQIYTDKEFDQAVRDYNLEENNVRYIPHAPVPRNIKRRPYYWWR